MPRVELKGIHRVTKKLASGAVREYHYAYRGGPKFWSSESAFDVGSADYLAAFLEASKPHLLRAAPKPGQGGSTAAVIRRYRQSIHYLRLANRTRKDYDKFLEAFDASFGEDPIRMFEEKEAVAEIRKWKEQWSRSPKQYDSHAWLPAF